MAPQLTMMEQCITRLLREILLPPTPLKDNMLLEKDPPKQPETARKSSTMRLSVGYAAARGEAKAGTR